jgi:anti-sigma factor RsiW
MAPIASCPDEQVLGAYLDGELEAPRRAEIESHLRGCKICARQLELMAEASRSLREFPFADITPAERLRLHQAIDAAMDRPILRIGGTLGLIAASIFVVGLAWLHAIPATAPRQPTAPVAVVKPAEPWENVAMTLRPDPMLQSGDPTEQIQLAENMIDLHDAGIKAP